MTDTADITTELILLKEKILRDLAIIEADCEPKHLAARVGCDHLTVTTAKRLTENVIALAELRASFIKPV